jgi:hypothetical protein
MKRIIMFLKNLWHNMFNSYRECMKIYGEALCNSRGLAGI